MFEKLEAVVGIRNSKIIFCGIHVVGWLVVLG